MPPKKKPSPRKGKEKETSVKKTTKPYIIPSTRVNIKKVPAFEPCQDQRLHTEYEEDPFDNLMRAINIRAGLILGQTQHICKTQKLSVDMDMSALYCLAATVEEYARELNTKRALDNEPPPSYLKDESFSKEHVLKKLRPTLKKEDVTTETYINDDDD